VKFNRSTAFACLNLFLGLIPSVGVSVGDSKTRIFSSHRPTVLKETLRFLVFCWFPVRYQAKCPELVITSGLLNDCSFSV